MSIRVLVNGSQGRMGQEAVQAITDAQDLTLVGQTTQGDDLVSAIQSTRAQVVVDFTSADTVFANSKTIIEANTHPVIGTSGLLPAQVEELQRWCADKQLGGLIAPNFSIGAVLMMKYAQDAARYLGQVEIIELHHAGKQDSPSGTSMKTAEMIAETRCQQEIPATPQHETIPGARGAIHQGVPIHAVRLPGLVAHQTVVFGGDSETLTLRHDSLHRRSFMPGVCLACRQVVGLKELVYGLEHIL